MIGIKTGAYRATVPVTLLVIAWVCVGRAFLAPDFLWVIGALMFVAPALAVLLGLTSGLAIAQHRPSEGFLTDPQFWSLLATWATVTGFGLFAVSGGAPPWAESPFTVIVGDGALDVSRTLATGCLYAFAPAYLTLLVLLIRGLRGRRERRAGTAASAASAASAARQ